MNDRKFLGLQLSLHKSLQGGLYIFEIVNIKYEKWIIWLYSRIGEFTAIFKCLHLCLQKVYR